MYCLTLVTNSQYSEFASRENHEEVVKLSLRLARRQGHHTDTSTKTTQYTGDIMFEKYLNRV
jgi:hypothetical protein